MKRVSTVGFCEESQQRKKTNFSESWCIFPILMAKVGKISVFFKLKLWA